MTIYKAATESVTNSTLINDAFLKFNLNANEKWQFEFHAYYDNNGGNIDNIRMALTGPATPTNLIYNMMINDNLANPTSAQSSLSYGSVITGSGSPGTVGTTNPGTLIIKGVVENGATAGNLQLQWAQNSTNATAIRVLRGSYLKMVRLP